MSPITADSGVSFSESIYAVQSMAAPYSICNAEVLQASLHSGSDLMAEGTCNKDNL
ncbi:MAG: hypothetical protein LBH03_05010 [Holophagales bacterium]|nr:hypothetical protein [Holophagales bacterium]